MGRRGNGEGTITRRKDGRWEARYTVHGAEGPKRKVLYGKTRGGSSTVNRGQAAHSASNSHRGLLPRHLGSSAGGTGYLNSSSVDQR